MHGQHNNLKHIIGFGKEAENTALKISSLIENVTRTKAEADIFGVARSGEGASHTQRVVCKAVSMARMKSEIGFAPVRHLRRR
jgi:hypothetical protein